MVAANPGCYILVQSFVMFMFGAKDSRVYNAMAENLLVFSKFHSIIIIFSFDSHHSNHQSLTTVTNSTILPPFTKLISSICLLQSFHPL